MSQSFDQPTWKARVAAWWRAHAPDWRQAMQRLGVETAYGMLTASAFLPLLDAYTPTDPTPTLAALIALTSGVGGNLVANVVQNVYNQATAPQHIEQEIAEQPELRAEYQRLLNRLDVLGAAQAAMGEQWAGFEAQLQEELARMGGGLHVEAGGGVFFGDVKVNHGDLVGRDKHEYHFHAAPPPPDFTPQWEAYLRHVVKRTSKLTLRGVDVGASDPTRTARPRLAQVYISLDTTTRIGDEALESVLAGHEIPWSFETGQERLHVKRLTPVEALGRGGREDQLLPALVAVAVSHFAVVLGDPGSGKSTFINHLAFCLAQHHLDPEGDWLAHLSGWPAQDADLLPVVVTLRDFARWARVQDLNEGHAGAMGDFLMEWLASRDLADFGAPLREALREGNVILFFDGLDEIPTGVQRALVRDAVVDFACTYEQARIVVTCRTLSYQEKAQRLSEDVFPIFELAPFTEEKIDQFIQAWYEELTRLGAVRPEEEMTLIDKLKVAVRRPDIFLMASNPLLLTVMALLHVHRGRLPEARALLYEECTDLLLWRWEEVKMQGDEAQLPGLRRLLQDADLQDIDFKRTLWALAFKAHDQGGSDDGATADIAEVDLLRALRELHPTQSWDWAAAVVQQIQDRAGLLVEREPGIYTFPHRTFQEYLAACHLSVHPDFAKRAMELSEEAAFWREVMLLAVGRQVHVSGNLAAPLALLAELCPLKCGKEDVTWRRAWRAGELLQEIGGRRVHQQGALGQELLERVRNRLAQLVAEGHLPPRERLEAGDVLGRLGDPRPGVGVHALPPRVGEGSGMGAHSLPPRAGEGPGMGVGVVIPDILWVPIPAGPYLMGSPDDDPDAYDHEKPQHELTLPAYYIARYPITNAQFRPFVEGDGYSNPAYWTEQGWAWRQGAEADLSIFDGVQDEERWKQQYREWLARRPVDKRDRPFFWEDSRLGAPTRPVVGITWFEAVAYTRWLEAQLNAARATLRIWRVRKVEEINVQLGTLKVQLPSEAEWEKAARGPVLSVAEGPGLSAAEGPGRKYPWGDAWQENCSNIESTDLKQTNPVGMFPDGASPYGVLEMAGNVWEWTRSRWGERSVTQADYEYPYNSDDGRERLEGMKIPILRGGSYYNDERAARCACRAPGGFDYDFGFRAVVSLVCSDC